ncbi:hypothetical protein [Pseudomonas sp. CGJS7]|uniref:hypothetical protein n=1 Tax=Pseudomonas sp. CGJS7 TaxID=3109348 RepID=UPI00300B78CD
MTNEKWEFSVARHVVFVDGYLDAVGRTLSTDTELWCLWTRTAEPGQEIETVLQAKVHEQARIGNWSLELVALCEQLLGLSERTRLGFYLIEYLRWFADYTRDAVCYRLTCDFLRSDAVAQSVYLLELENQQRVLICATRSIRSV